MKIGFDAKRAMSNMTGLGNYSRLVIESMALSYPNDDFVLYAPRLTDNPRLRRIHSLNNISIRTPQASESKFGKSLWRTFGISHSLRADAIDLYHGLSNELPLNIKKSHIASVVTIHDIIYRRLPYCYKPIDRKIYDFKYGHSCRNATRIIAISECTKRDIMKYYGIDENKIDVVYQGCDDSFRHHFTPDEINAITRKYGISTPYIIQVGSIERRKNALLTLRAMTSLSPEIKLVLVGKATSYLREIYETANKCGLASRLQVIHNVPFADLPALYQGALAASYPSFYEGFGIPVLEALCSHTPCVAATGSCLEEAGGSGALYVNPEDVRGMSEALQSLCNNQNLRTHLIGEGQRQASRFDNSTIPHHIMKVYQRALESAAKGVNKKFD